LTKIIYVAKQSI